MFGFQHTSQARNMICQAFLMPESKQRYPFMRRKSSLQIKMTAKDADTCIPCSLYNNK
jgi:hypothetical protein